MACFAMIGDIDTTSCLALSALNDSATEIGACEGDLDAGLTLYLLKAMGRI
jgi:L-fucose isomerase-like protein